MSGLDGLHLTARDALYLDFDGTLAEIGPDPEAIMLPEATLLDLQVLAQRLGGALALLSGRDLRDLARRTPEGVWRVGGHGLEILAPGDVLPPPAATPPAELMAALEPVTAVPGIRVEVKGAVVALHFRAAPDAEPRCLAVARAAVRACPDYRLQRGKMIVELKPAGADKGRALRRLAEREPFADRRPVMLGDDATDEDAMRAALDLGGVAVKIGAGKTVAPRRAPDPAAVRAWLTREAAG